MLVNNATYYATQTIGGCESTIALAVTVSDPLEEPLGIYDVHLEKIAAYPNPVTNILNINAIGLSVVKVYSLAGQLLIDKVYSTNTAEIDMQSLAEGSYIVKIIAGGKTGSYLIIKGGR